MYPARGAEEVIRIYRSDLIRKAGHKLSFDLYDESMERFLQKHYAYAASSVASELHRQHCYRVAFNDDSKHPRIIAILEEVTCSPSLD